MRFEYLPATPATFGCAGRNASSVLCRGMCRESGLSALVHHLSELEDWDAVLLQEIYFKDEQADMDALEASLGGHKSVINPNCPWDTAVVIHCRWKAPLRWYASTRHPERPPSCGGVHVLFSPSAELGR